MFIYTESVYVSGLSANLNLTELLSRSTDSSLLLANWVESLPPYMEAYVLIDRNPSLQRPNDCNTLSAERFNTGEFLLLFASPRFAKEGRALIAQLNAIETTKVRFLSERVR